MMSSLLHKLRQRLPAADHYDELTYKAIGAALITHIIMIGIFAYLYVPILVWANIIGFFIYVSSYEIVRRRAFKVYFFISVIEIIFQGCLATYILGWETGFHYYVLIAIYVAFFFPTVQMKYKLSVLFLNIITYILLSHSTSSPVVSLAPNIKVFLHGFNVFTVFSILAILSANYRRSVDNLIASLNEKNKELDVMASTDSLTHLLTRRRMFVYLKKAIQQKQNFYLLLVDIDNFKQFNDNYGYEYGDTVLTSCAKVMQDLTQEEDSVARWGGEEFLVLLRNTDKEGAIAFAENLRSRIKTNKVPCGDLKLSVSVTIGVAAYEDNEEISVTISNAGKALRAGKSKGKNSVKMYNK